MMDGGYIYDNEHVKFRKMRTPVKKRIRRVILLFLASLSLAVVYYVVFALLFSTEEEKRLQRENEMFERELPQLQQKQILLADVLEGLNLRDDRIYEEIFHASSPSMNPVPSISDVSSLDTIPDQQLVWYTQQKLSKVTSSAAKVEADFMRIAELLQDSAFVMPPMCNPLGDFTFAQTGASVGEKINPFYKVPIHHNGLDLVAHSGEPVYATADGVVINVIKSRKGLGNVVEISHEGGYVTRYAHLADIEVKKGRKVAKGSRIGYVGVSGNSFAPHLHYEVIRDTLVMDPVNHLFGSLDPEEYVNVMIMAATTGQSLD
jgi:murein DD-endopeptidase MepM/ murein hydrolase activator NlpD